MITVAEVIRNMSIKDIVDTYTAYFCGSYEMVENRDLSLKELHEIDEAIAMKAIERILNADPAESHFMFFVGYAYEDSIITEHAYYIDINDLNDTTKEASEVGSYSCLMTKASNIAGSYVAETERTKKNLPYLIAAIIEEMSFFDSDEEIEAEAEKLKQVVEEIKSGEAETYPLDEKFFDDLGVERRRKYPEEEEYYQKMIEAEIALNSYLYTSEIEQLRTDGCGKGFSNTK